MSSTSKFSILSLNVQGLRNKRKRKKVFKWLGDHNCHNNVTFLQETHSDVKCQSGWSHEIPGTCYFAHGTTNSFSP